LLELEPGPARHPHRPGIRGDEVTSPLFRQYWDCVAISASEAGHKDIVEACRLAMRGHRSVYTSTLRRLRWGAPNAGGPLKNQHAFTVKSVAAGRCAASAWSVLSPTRGSSGVGYEPAARSDLRAFIFYASEVAVSHMLESPEVAPGPALHAGEDVFGSLHLAVRKRMLAGHGLGAVEDELIDPAPVSTEEKAVLWLLAWSLLPSNYQLAEVEAHIALLSN